MAERGSVGTLLTRAVYRLSPKRTLHGIPTAVLFLSSDEERAVIFRKVEDGLALIRAHAPGRMSQVQRDLRSILVCGDPSAAAYYVHALKMCELSFHHVASEGTSSAEVAAAIVHEAQHARLDRLGFGYSDAVRPRIESLCHRAERVFGLRCPDGIAVVEKADRALASHPETFTETGRAAAKIAALEKLAIPAWFRRLMAFFIRRQLRRT